MGDFFDSEFDDHLEVARATKAQLRGAFERIAAAWLTCIKAGNKILFFGDGGSAADARHLATELAELGSVSR